MRELWQYIVDNRDTLGWLGGGFATLIGGAWAVVTYFFPSDGKKSPASSTTTVTQTGIGIASGRDTVISAPVSIGLDEKKTGEQITAAQKPLTDQLERLVAQVSREKGVPVAPLRAILVKLGEAGASEEAIPQRLDAQADELLKLREEIAQLKQGPVELASFAQRAQTLIDQGHFDDARTALAEGRARAHKLREQSSRYEADFLAREAQIDHLQLSYRSAAAKYLEAAALMAGVDPEKRWQFLYNHAAELYLQGDEFGDSDALLQAITAYRAVLEQTTPARAPLDWAMVQNDLGTALIRMGERQVGSAWLKEAIAAFNEALTERTRERVPLDWAMTQSNLAIALALLGEYEGGTALLERAIAALLAALTERTRARVPLDWAMTQANLGNALVILGERESSPARLQEAVAAYRATLNELTRERMPLAWAGIQNNLGAALVKVSKHQSGTARLQEAVAAFRAALTERTRERAPLRWAATQNNLANALLNLGERESGTARLEEAVTTFRAALTETSRERAPLDWALQQNNLGNALLTLGERESGTARLQDAIVAYKAALSVETFFSEGSRAGLEQAEALLTQRRYAVKAL